MIQERIDPGKRQTDRTRGNHKITGLDVVKLRTEVVEELLVRYVQIGFRA